MSKNVSPTAQNPPFDILLSDGVQEFGLILDGGPRGIQEVPSSGSTMLVDRAGQRYGDGDPTFSHVEQRTWHGGRGQEDYAVDPTKFYDSKEAWVLSSTRLMPAPQWGYASGIRTADNHDHYGKNMVWKALTGTQRYISVSFAASASYSADKASFWIRRAGVPGTLTVELCADSSGDPGTVLKTATVTTASVTDVISAFYPFDWTTTQSLTASTTYHLKIYGASTDNNNNHWEVGVDTTGSAGKISTAGSSWSAASFTPYYRIVAADTLRKWLLFELEGATYAVSVEDSGANSTLMINGDRGTATSATSTSITTTGKTWTTDRWAGARVRIIGGTGLVGESRAISSNTATALTVSSAFSITPDNTTRYVIYDTKWWTEITGHGFGAVKHVAVGANVAYFAQGASVNMRRMRNNASSHDFAADGTNRADLLYSFFDQADGAQIWKALNGTTVQIARANAVTWGTDLTFRTGIQVGHIKYPITGLCDYNNQFWVGKQDSVWLISNDKPVRVNIGLEAIPYSQNASAMVAHNLFLVFNWWKSAERMYGGTVDDFGMWKDAGLPSSRDGFFSAFVPALTLLFSAFDAGTSGYSGVYVFNDAGWSELFRSPVAGHRCRNIAIQACEDSRPIVWVSCNGELMYFRLSMSPVADTGMYFNHEATMISSTIDLERAQRPKYFEEIAILADNLASGREIHVDYQVDDDIGGDTWINAGTILSMETTAKIHRGNVRKIRYRLRITTNVATTPVVINAVILKGYARAPVKRQWNIRVKTATNMRDRTGALAAKPDDLYEWLWESCQSAAGIRMRTTLMSTHDTRVVVEPPTRLFKFINTIAKAWGGYYLLTLREV